VPLEGQSSWLTGTIQVGLRQIVDFQLPPGLFSTDMSSESPYSLEPHRNSRFTINSQEPFNAEPPIRELTKSFVTPNDLFFVRNHAPVPDVRLDTFRLSISGLVQQPLTLSLTELQNGFRKVRVMATLMCAGNRRTELHNIQPVRGVGWGAAAISNAVWGGVSLRDVLLAAGVSPDSHNMHVAFEGLDHAKGAPYGSSIPIEKAMDVNGAVVLAYEMNEETLPRDHGFPLRVVVPGYIGARSVKWLSSVTVQKEESSNFFQKKDYKVFPSQVTWDTVGSLWDVTPAILELNVQAAITFPEDGSMVEGGLPCFIRGYAIAGGGRRISRVDVSINRGNSWDTASLIQEKGSTSSGNHHWSWTLWSYKVDQLPAPCEIVCRAWDSAFNGMQSEREWNLRGVMNNSWYKVKVLPVEHSSKL